MMPPRKLLIVMILVAVSSPLPVTGLELEGPVGQWGDPARLRLEGATQLDPQAISKGLRGSFSHFMASHPSAPLAGFANSVQQHLVRGYQHAGFSEVSAQVRLDDEQRQVVATIDEGQRSHIGAIHIDGPLHVRKLLEDLLGQRRAPDGATPTELSDYGGAITWADADGKKVDEEKPLWIAGLPAKFDAAATEARRKRAQQCLADLGYHAAQFKSTAVVHGPVADWHIRIDDLGPPAVLRSIETTGNRKNTREEIVDYLNLRPGTVVTRMLREQIERSLWNSARFAASKVDVQRLPDGQGVQLRIDVAEYPHASPLSAPLTREEQAMLKHRHWMVDGPGSQLDIVVTATRAHGKLEVIISPTEGVSCGWWKSVDDQSPPVFALLATDEDIAAHAVTARRSISAPVTGVQLNATLSMLLNTDDPEHPFKVNFGFGFESLEAGERRAPLTLTTSMPPVYFVAQVHEKAECSWEGSILTIRSKQGEMRINERTGEFIGHRSRTSDVDGTRFDYAFARRAFARRRQQIQDALASAANEFEVARPITSVSAFLLTTGMLSEVGGFMFGEPFAERVPRASLAVLGQLIDRGLFAVPDHVVASLLADDGEVFKVPSMPSAEQQHQPMHFYGFLVAQAADHVFPRDSWAWTMWRESSLVVAGLGQHTGTELNKFMSDHRCGPSSYWLLAELLRSIQHPAVGAVAERALTKFNRQAFIDEWESALGSQLHPSVAATLASLQSLSDDDAAALLAFVDGPQPEWIRIVSQLRAASEPRAGDATADLLNAVWATDLRVRLEQRLRQLATPARVAERLPDVER